MNVPWAFASEKQQQAIRELIDHGRRGGHLRRPYAHPGEIAARDLQELGRVAAPGQATAERRSCAIARPAMASVSITRIGLPEPCSGSSATCCTRWRPTRDPTRPTSGRSSGDGSGACTSAAWRVSRTWVKTPMDILIAATRNGAAAYGLEDDLGTVEEGKIADLLILDADPLEDIGNLQRDPHGPQRWPGGRSRRAADGQGPGLRSGRALAALRP